MKSSGFFIFVSLMCSILIAQSNEGSSSDNTNAKSNVFIVCSRLKETRWLRAFKLENGRCKAYYSKEGYVQIVSSSSYFSSCEAVLNTVRKNIEEGGFKCSEKSLVSMVEIE